MAAAASCGALALAQPSVANATSPVLPKNGTHASVQWMGCRVPSGAIGQWWYNNRDDGPYDCYGPDYQSWSMLNSYRSGGTQNVHWTSTDNVNDPECMADWKYYAEDGTTLYAKINGRTTLVRAACVPYRRCRLLPVADCSCWEE